VGKSLSSSDGAEVRCAGRLFHRSYLFALPYESLSIVYCVSFVVCYYTKVNIVCLIFCNICFFCPFAYSVFINYTAPDT